MDRKQLVGDLLAKANKYRGFARWVSDRQTVQRITALTIELKQRARALAKPDEAEIRKRAREIWYLCRRYSAKEAYDMGMANTVVPHDKLDEEIDKWCAEIREKSPTALAIAKRSFNADSEHLRAIGALGFEALALFYGTEESKEGGRAFREKRKPNFRDKKK